ncbi:hypothetical protein T4D_10375 [Trichinella pseudospiralis]|uniref:Uncharacterized protein n=1 Tax=Trichinella pseudospiralis TaxID=6337 RepID=A0A0V1FWE3_TRIPS|nr:hypothetical protein T4D_10375 [Trichinella pseudospiralis]
MSKSFVRLFWAKVAIELSNYFRTKQTQAHFKKVMKEKLSNISNCHTFVKAYMQAYRSLHVQGVKFKKRTSN